KLPSPSNPLRMSTGSVHKKTASLTGTLSTLATPLRASRHIPELCRSGNGRPHQRLPAPVGLGADSAALRSALALEPLALKPVELRPRALLEACKSSNPEPQSPPQAPWRSQRASCRSTPPAQLPSPKNLDFAVCFSWPTACQN